MSDMGSPDRSNTKMSNRDSPAAVLPLQDKLQRPRISNLSQRPFSDELWAQPSHNLGAFAPARVTAPAGFANLVWALSKEVIRFNVRGTPEFNHFSAEFFRRLVATRSGAGMEETRRLVQEGVSFTDDAATDVTDATDYATDVTAGSDDVRGAGDGEEERPIFFDAGCAVDAESMESGIEPSKAESAATQTGGWGRGDGDVSIAFSGPELQRFWLEATKAGAFAARELGYEKHL